MMVWDGMRPDLISPRAYSQPGRAQRQRLRFRRESRGRAYGHPDQCRDDGDRCAALGPRPACQRLLRAGGRCRRAALGRRGRKRGPPSGGVRRVRGADDRRRHRRQRRAHGDRQQRDARLGSDASPAQDRGRRSDPASDALDRVRACGRSSRGSGRCPRPMCRTPPGTAGWPGPPPRSSCPRSAQTS